MKRIGRITAALAATCLCAALPPPASAGGSGPPLPRIVAKPISFPTTRKLETQAYAKRHYGMDTWRLRNPHVIVEHVTASSSFTSAFSTFNADVADSELHELPGICAHFVIDTDGTIYQLVPLGVMCRHTVGLNWTAIGIEHVGISDGQILRNGAQMASSLALTAWLMNRFDIGLADVIGHNESLTSRFHHELYRGWRCQTHADWRKADMDVYRSRLGLFARRSGIQVGGRVQHATPRC